MTNRNIGQIRIGKSGPIVIGGGNEPQQSLEVQQSQISENNFKEEDLMSKNSTSKDKHRHSKKKKKIIRSISKTDKFNLLVEDNKESGKSWCEGLVGDWWWGMTEEEARMRLIEIEKAFETNSKKLAITSIVRNEERNGYLKKFLNCCHNLEKIHKDIIYIFIEGDSSDNTFGVLKNWLTPKKNYILKKVDRKHRPFAKDRNPRRTIYFAELRNMLIDLALSIPEVSEILMIDANYGWKGDLISSLRETDTDIAAPLVVNHKHHDGKYLFYDTWAFRKDGRQFSQFYPYVKGLDSESFNLDSVGGGYLIKRRVLEQGVRYKGEKDCEHVGFCTMAKDMGFNIKINPKIYIKKGGHEE